MSLLFCRFGLIWSFDRELFDRELSPGAINLATLARCGAMEFYRLRPGPVRDFGTERALAEPLGPIYMIFPSSSTRFTLLTELNLTVPKARPEAHTFDFIGIIPPLYFVD